MTINNTGTLPGTYRLEGTASGALAPSLNLEIYKDADNEAGSRMYDGTLAVIATAFPLDLGTFAATSGTHTYYFHVTIPTTGSDAGDNALQGKAASAGFTWKATQV